MWWKITIMAEYVFEIACFVPKIRKPFFLMFNLCFGHFWATETSCKHNTKVLSPYEVDVSNQSLIYMSSTPWSNISIYSEPCLCLPGKWKFNLHSPFSYIFGLHHLLREISVSLVYQSRFTENSCLLLLMHWDWTKTVQLWAVRPKQWAESCIEGDCRVGDNSLLVHHYKQQLSNYIKTLIITTFNELLWIIVNVNELIHIIWHHICTITNIFQHFTAAKLFFYVFRIKSHGNNLEVLSIISYSYFQNPSSAV